MYCELADNDDVASERLVDFSKVLEIFKKCENFNEFLLGVSVSILFGELPRIFERFSK
jgi:hypothetical protein